MSTLKKVPFFADFQSVAELEEYIEQFTGSERALASLIMCITWNTIANLIEKDEENETIST